MRMLAVPILAAISMLALRGQEAAVEVYALEAADAVVVGTLRHDFRYPWFNGWNERGHIVVEQVLKGGAAAGTRVPFAWERPLGWVPPGCLSGSDWTHAVNQRKVWILRWEGTSYRADLFTGTREASDLPAVVRRLQSIISAGDVVAENASRAGKSTTPRSAQIQPSK